MKRAHNYQDLTGLKINRLTFLEFAGRTETRNARWKVRCDCGTVFEVTATEVKRGCTKSCGCYRTELNKAGRRNKSNPNGKDRKDNTDTRPAGMDDKALQAHQE